MTNFEKDVFRQSLIFHIPHSSINIPNLTGFNVDLIQTEINLLTDFDTDLIFNVPDTRQIVTDFSRVFCDVERLPDNEEDMFEYGRGFFYTNCDNGDILRQDVDGIKQHVFDNYYTKHHQKFEQMIEETLDEIGFVTIIDCHSFANTPFKTDLNQNFNRPDICLGTSSSTPNWLLTNLDLFFKLNQYNVSHNSPYSGTIIPKKYENYPNVNSIMIELNRDLYMIDDKSDTNLVKKLNQQIIELFD